MPMVLLPSLLALQRISILQLVVRLRLLMLLGHDCIRKRMAAISHRRMGVRLRQRVHKLRILLVHVMHVRLRIVLACLRVMVRMRQLHIWDWLQRMRQCVVEVRMATVHAASVLPRLRGHSAPSGAWLCSRLRLLG